MINVGQGTPVGQTFGTTVALIPDVAGVTIDPFSSVMSPGLNGKNVTVPAS